MLLRSTIRTLDHIAARLGRAPNIAPHLAFGARGEDEAYFYLRKLGFTIIARDYRSPRRPGDIDLIAFEKDTLCFIEVTTRATRKFLPAEAAVGEEKRATLSALAHEYLRQYTHAQGKQPPHRFDVISVYIESNDDLGDSADITLFRNAFTMS
jgi:putative endonuclease